ncbi:MAG: DUF192 domain-containing protein [Bryobacterales bacterium]
MSARYLLLLTIVLFGCGSTDTQEAPAAATWEAEGPMTTITLPNGSTLQAELRQTPQEQASGMMFRPELPPGYGMLFVFETLEPRAFGCTATLHPLDMVAGREQAHR